MEHSEVAFKDKERGRIGYNALFSCFVAGLLTVQFIQLNYSAMPSFSVILGQGIRMICVNVLAVALPNLLLCLVLRSWKRTLLFTSIFFTLWSIANYYVIKFHGSPLFFSEFSNFETAMTVDGNYHFAIDRIVCRLFALFALELAALAFLHFQTRKTGERKKGSVLLSICLICADTALLYLALFSTIAIKPGNSMLWSWVPGVQKYGYVSCLIEDAVKMRRRFVEPKDYDAGKIKYTLPDVPLKKENGPDIIFILNESFLICRHIQWSKRIPIIWRALLDLIMRFSVMPLRLMSVEEQTIRSMSF